MIELDKRIDAARRALAKVKEELDRSAEDDHEARWLKELEAAKREAELELLCDLSLESGVGRMPETDEDFERSFVVVVTERLEDRHHGWEAFAKLPSGRILAGSLSDDMPHSAGSALVSLGHMLDSVLSNERLERLWRLDRELATLRAKVEAATKDPDVLEIFDRLVR